MVIDCQVYYVLCTIKTWLYYPPLEPNDYENFGYNVSILALDGMLAITDAFCQLAE